MYLREFKRTYGEIQLAHRDRDRAPIGAYDEDYHYYTYEEQPSGDYVEYKNIVSKNGTTRTVMHGEIDKEEYFKRKLAGTLRDDKLYAQTGVYDIAMLGPWLKHGKRKADV